MDNLSRLQESETSRQVGILSKLRVFHGLLYWLINIFQLTEVEQRNAGIVMSDQRYK